jgi:hypothetical protein
MDIAVVKNAVGSLDKLLGRARDALWDVEREVFGDPGYGHAVYAYPRAAMEAFLEELHDILLVFLEAANMPETRASLIDAWREFRDGKGLADTIDDEELQTCESPALTFLERLIQGLRITVSEAISSEEAWTLNRLEAMLRDTPGLVHRRQIAPANEIKLQEIMHDYLRACFPDFRLNPPIGGTLKNFKPDFGIASVGAAIEFKIVHTKEQVAIAFSGIAEDSAGYKGSKDWTRFYAVIYQAQPFMLESHLRSDLKRIGATTWTAIVVNGPTESTKSRAKKAGRNKKAVQGSHR